MNLTRRLAAAVALGIGWSLAGCSEQTGPARYAVSGTVALFDGKPVPAGEISFEPDSASGSAAPAAMAQIKDGQFSLAKEQGIGGGKYTVIILPFDGVPFGESSIGKPLRSAPYSETVEFPAEDSTRDFKLPR